MHLYTKQKSGESKAPKQRLWVRVYEDDVRGVAPQLLKRHLLTQFELAHEQIEENALNRAIRDGAAQ